MAEVSEKTTKINELHKKTQQLETELADHRKQYAEYSKCSQELEERLCRENIGLAEWFELNEFRIKKNKI